METNAQSLKINLMKKYISSSLGENVKECKHFVEIQEKLKREEGFKNVIYKLEKYLYHFNIIIFQTL